MIKPRVIVTGATGKTGSIVASELLKAGYPVRAMVRREDERSARLKAQGAEIAVADMSDVERVADALKDVQRAYYCPPLDPYMIQGAVAFAVAAKEARLENIAGILSEGRNVLGLMPQNTTGSPTCRTSNERMAGGDPKGRYPQSVQDFRLAREHECTCRRAVARHQSDL